MEMIQAKNLLSITIYDLGQLLVFLLLGMLLLKYIAFFRKLYLPAGLIGGVITLFLGPQGLQWLSIPPSWSGMATPMIGITILCSLFGTTINGTKLKKYAGTVNLLVFTYFAQMVVGTLVGVLLSQIWTNMPEGWGVMAIFTYWGGHGAAASSGALFEHLGREGMLSLGIVMATFGLVIAMVAGIVWVNIGERKGWSQYRQHNQQTSFAETDFPLPISLRKPIGFSNIPSDIANSLAIQLGIVFGCVLLGKWIFHQLSLIPIPIIADIMKNIPVFLYGTIGAIIVWPLLKVTHTEDYADIPTIKNIGGVALEICILSATATIDLEVLSSFLVPLLLHMVAIVITMSIICMYLLRRWLKDDWFESALMAFGQGHGSTPSGLALARCTDPNNKSFAWEAFGIALGVVTPFTSIMAAAFPALVTQSILYPILIGGGVSLLCLCWGEFVLKKRKG